MILLPTDIETRRERNGRQTVWVAERLLVAKCNGLNESYLWKKARPEYAKSVPAHRRTQDIMPDTGEAWRFARMNGGWYYDLERIPDKAPARYRSKLPSAEQLLAEHARAMADNRQGDLEKWVRQAVRSDSRGYMGCWPDAPGLLAERLSRDAAALDAAALWAAQHGIDTRKSAFFADLAVVSGRLGLGLPGNWRRMKEKVVEVLGGAAAHEVVRPKNLGNQNARKHEDEVVMAWCLTMRSHGANWTNADIARRVQSLCLIHERPAPSLSTVEHYLAQDDVKRLTTLRWGANGRRAMQYKGYVPIAGAAFAGDVWMMDGTRVNLIEWADEQGKWQHLMVVMVMDGMSGAILGRAYGRAENRWMYAEALAKAATRAGYLPYEIVTDRFPGHNTDEWKATVRKLEQAGTRVTTAFEMQGKARLERAIDTWQMAGLQKSAYYYGQGVQSRRAYAHRSEDYLNSLRKKAKAEGWGMAQAIEEAERAFDLYNATKLSAYSRAKKAVDRSPLELHFESEAPHTAKFDRAELLQFFGLSKDIQVAHQGMIVTEINRRKITYVIGAEDWAAVMPHKRVRMYYDLEDLGAVQLYTITDDPADEDFLCEARAQDQVKRWGPLTEDDKAAMGRAVRRIEKIEAMEQAMLNMAKEMGGMEDTLLLGMSTPKERREAAETAFHVRRRQTASAMMDEVVALAAPDDEEEETALPLRAGRQGARRY